MVLAIVVAAGCGTGEPAGDDAGSRGHRVQHLAFAGPAFAGRALVWGEEFRDGSLAVIRQRPGRRAQVVHRIATPSGRDRERSFLGLPGALSASSKWIVYGLDNAKVTVDGDLVVREPHSRAFGTYGGGPFRELLPGCGDAAYVATATEADAVAVAQVGGSCGGEYVTRVWVIEGGAGPRLVYRAPGARVAMRQVQLAGRWIAWSEGGSGAGDKRITVADRASGNIAARLTPGDLPAARPSPRSTSTPPATWSRSRGRSRAATTSASPGETSTGAPAARSAAARATAAWPSRTDASRTCRFGGSPPTV